MYLFFVPSHPQSSTDLQSRGRGPLLQTRIRLLSSEESPLFFRWAAESWPDVLSFLFCFHQSTDQSSPDCSGHQRPHSSASSGFWSTTSWVRDLSTFLRQNQLIQENIVLVWLYPRSSPFLVFLQSSAGGTAVAEGSVDMDSVWVCMSAFRCDVLITPGCCWSGWLESNMRRFRFLLSLTCREQFEKVNNCPWCFPEWIGHLCPLDCWVEWFLFIPGIWFKPTFHPRIWTSQSSGSTPFPYRLASLGNTSDPMVQFPLILEREHGGNRRQFGTETKVLLQETVCKRKQTSVAVLHDCSSGLATPNKSKIFIHKYSQTHAYLCVCSYKGFCLTILPKENRVTPDCTLLR